MIGFELGEEKAFTGKFGGMNHSGMKMREYFAAHAPITMDDAYVTWRQDISRGEPTASELVEKVVELRVQYADQMLAALEQKK